VDTRANDTMSDALYIKTTEGTAEVAARSPRLNMAQRRVLIMADGRRTVAELAQFVPQGNIDEVLDLLTSLGLIARAADGAQEDAGPSAPVGAAEPLDVPTVTGVPSPPTLTPAPGEPEPMLTLDEAKRRAVRELTDRLGPDADMLAMKIEACRSADEFRERLRDAERLVSALRGAEAGQGYLRALRRR
jgi:hypothetical protein